MDRLRCLGIIAILTAHTHGAVIKKSLIEATGHASFGTKIPVTIVDAASGEFTPEPCRGKVSVDLSKLTTGISLRDSHTKDLVGSTSSLRFECAGEKFIGWLTLKGVEAPVEGKFQSSPLRLEFQIQLSQFKIAAPSHAGISVKDGVSITARVD